MHVVATNVCVWIRTLVLETLKDITVYHKSLGRKEIGLLGMYTLLIKLTFFINALN